MAQKIQNRGAVVKIGEIEIPTFKKSHTRNEFLAIPQKKGDAGWYTVTCGHCATNVAFTSSAVQQFPNGDPFLTCAKCERHIFLWCPDSETLVINGVEIPRKAKSFDGSEVLLGKDGEAFARCYRCGVATSLNALLPPSPVIAAFTSPRWQQTPAGVAFECQACGVVNFPFVPENSALSAGKANVPNNDKLQTEPTKPPEEPEEFGFVLCGVEMPAKQIHAIEGVSVKRMTSRGWYEATCLVCGTMLTVADFKDGKPWFTCGGCSDTYRRMEPARLFNNEEQPESPEKSKSDLEEFKRHMSGGLLNTDVEADSFATVPSSFHKNWQADTSGVQSNLQKTIQDAVTKAVKVQTMQQETHFLQMTTEAKQELLAYFNAVRVTPDGKVSMQLTDEAKQELLAYFKDNLTVTGGMIAPSCIGPRHFQPGLIESELWGKPALEALVKNVVMHVLADRAKRDKEEQLAPAWHNYGTLGSKADAVARPLSVTLLNKRVEPTPIPIPETDGIPIPPNTEHMMVEMGLGGYGSNDSSMAKASVFLHSPATEYWFVPPGGDVTLRTYAEGNHACLLLAQDVLQPADRVYVALTKNTGKAHVTAVVAFIPASQPKPKPAVPSRPSDVNPVVGNTLKFGCSPPCQPQKPVVTVDEFPQLPALPTPPEKTALVGPTITNNQLGNPELLQYATDVLSRLPAVVQTPADIEYTKTIKSNLLTNLVANPKRLVWPAAFVAVFVLWVVLRYLYT